MITDISVQFRGSPFEGLPSDELEGIDIDASHRGFCALVEARIKAVYPDAAVSVDLDDRTTAGAYVGPSDIRVTSDQDDTDDWDEEAEAEDLIRRDIIESDSPSFEAFTVTKTATVEAE